MISERLLEGLNNQIQYEFFSHHIYLDMAAYCYSEDLDGFAHFFLVQAEEERFHAMKFYDFIQSMDQNVVMKGIDMTNHDFASIEEVFSQALSHEKVVTSRIYDLMDIATEEKEHATISFLKWFIDEQVEEESTFRTILQKVKRAGNDSALLYAIDKELGQRVFTPPAQ